MGGFGGKLFGVLQCLTGNLQAVGQIGVVAGGALFKQALL